MTKLKTAIVAMTIGCAVSALQPANAITSFARTQKLKENCQNTGNIHAQGICFGFVMGVVDFAMGEDQVCLPQGVTMPQIRDVVVQHLQQHPELGHYSAMSVVREKLIETWPCNQ